MDSIFADASTPYVQGQSFHFTEYFQSAKDFPNNFKQPIRYKIYPGNHSNIFFHPSEEMKIAYKLFKKELFPADSTAAFFNQIFEMAKLQHPALVQLNSWNFSRITNINGEALTPRSENLPIIAMPLYSQFKEIDLFESSNDKTQLFLFIYGYCRGFRFLNTFNHSTDSVHEDHILFSKPRDSDKLKVLNLEPSDQYYYPIISFFCTEEALQEAKTSTERTQNINNHLYSFCEFLDSLDNIKDKENPYSIFYGTFHRKDIQNDFSQAIDLLENQIVPLLLKQNLINQKVYDRYKRVLDRFESEYLQLMNRSEQVSQVETVLKKNVGNQYRTERQILKLAKQGNPEACLRIAINFYTGNILPKDLVSSIQFLRLNIKHGYSPMAELLVRTMVSIRDRKIVTEQNKYEITHEIAAAFTDEEDNDHQPDDNSDTSLLQLLMNWDDDDVNHLEQFDPVTLYYKGAFYEALAISSFQEIASNDEETNNESIKSQIPLYQQSAIKCYMESIKRKPMKNAIGRLGALLMRSSRSEYQSKGLALIRKAIQMGDLYASIFYGMYQFHDLQNHTYSNDHKKKKENRLIQQFTDLEKVQYLDAASALGDLYYQMYQDAINCPHPNQNEINEIRSKAIEQYKKAIEIFGDDSKVSRYEELKNLE